MNPETFIAADLPLADLVVLDNLLGDIESRTGSRDVSKQKGHAESNGSAVLLTSTDASNGSTVKPQNGNAASEF
jgi:hypothetical protein